MASNVPEDRREYDDYSIGSEEYYAPVLVGTIPGGPAPVFYDERSRTVFEAEADHESRELVPVAGSERELDPSETLADALEEIADETGWESLSDWAEEHLENDE